jgi:arsenate reductase-like glutaredoxin family protein
MHYHNSSIQIGPSDNVEVFRRSCGDGDNWLKIKDLPIEYGILIDGATADEIDTIVDAFNAPIMRRRAELAAKIAAFRSNSKDGDIFDAMLAHPTVIVEEQTK